MSGMTPPTCMTEATGAKGLFGELPLPSTSKVQQVEAKALAERRAGPVRIQQPDRSQVELRALDLDALVPHDHRARLVWGYVVRQDLSRLIDEIKARGSNAGRAAIDPHILFALWLYATLDGVGSGRELARLTLEHDAYRWICGGVSVNYHALNDFRSGNAALMDELLSSASSAFARRWSNCPRWLRPRSAMEARPKRRARAPPMPTRG